MRMNDLLRWRILLQCRINKHALLVLLEEEMNQTQP